jgi:hypothetical protein
VRHQAGVSLRRSGYSLPDLAGPISSEFPSHTPDRLERAPSLSPRYANWPQNFTLVTLRANKAIVAIAEWEAKMTATLSRQHHLLRQPIASHLSISTAAICSRNQQLLSADGHGNQRSQAYSAIAASGPGSVASVSASFASGPAPEALAAGSEATSQRSSSRPRSSRCRRILGGTSVRSSSQWNLAPCRDAFVSPGQLNYQYHRVSRQE